VEDAGFVADAAEDINPFGEAGDVVAFEFDTAKEACGVSGESH
jgi:hypothetical protein